MWFSIGFTWFIKVSLLLVMCGLISFEKKRMWSLFFLQISCGRWHFAIRSILYMERFARRSLATAFVETRNVSGWTWRRSVRRSFVSAIEAWAGFPWSQPSLIFGVCVCVCVCLIDMLMRWLHWNCEIRFWLRPAPPGLRSSSSSSFSSFSSSSFSFSSSSSSSSSRSLITGRNQWTTRNPIESAARVDLIWLGFRLLLTFTGFYLVSLRRTVWLS